MTTTFPRPTAPLPPLAAPAVVRAVTRFEVASARTAELSALMDTRDLSGVEFDAFEFAQDVMRESVAALAGAGMLHLVAAEHEKTKDELPKRPRGPHPQYAKAVA
jgi:hypothetical protein